MNEFLMQVFGENGALIGELAVTAVVIFILLLLVVWIGRRFMGLRAGGAARGRVARLAVVDALAIDSRRRLLLVRRDAVEHLILIGGPSDIVVEPSIIRTRQRPAQPAAGGGLVATLPGTPTSHGASAREAPLPNALLETAALTAAPLIPAAPHQATASADSGPPIPFPFSRVPPAVPAASLSNGKGSARMEARSPDRAPVPPWLSSPSTPSVAPAGGNGSSMPPGGPQKAAGPDERLARPIDLETNGKGGRPANGKDPFSATARPEFAAEGSPARKVSELEAEMNRLLGELAADRRSP